MANPGAKSAYFPHVDGLRAIAILSVLIYHLNPAWLPGGFSGVDIFFVISGFIVSASVGLHDRVGLLKFLPFFYARRLQRIGPALVVCLLLTSVATAMLIPEAWLSRANQEAGLYAFFGLSNFILAQTSNDYFSPISEFNPYTHTWSLGVEEQFYFIFPFIFFAWTFHGKWRRLTVALFMVALVASLGYSAWLGQTNKTLAFYMITSRFWQLAAGVLLFQSMALSGCRFDGAKQPPSRWFPVGALFSLLLIGYGFVFSRPESFPFPGALPSVLGALGLLRFLHGVACENPMMRLLAGRPMLFIGKISYSLYLWHWPVFVLFRWTVGMDMPIFQVTALAMAFSLATASYYWVETPLRYLRAVRRLPRYAVVAVGLTLIGASAWLNTVINKAQPKLSVSTIARNAGDWYPWGTNISNAYPGCVLETSNMPIGTGYVSTYSPQHCDYPASGPRVFAIGDSHAIGYVGLYTAYAMKTGAPVTVYNNGGCPFVSLQPWREDNDNCRANAKAAVDDMIRKIKPGDVVFLASLRMPRFADQWIRFPDADVEQKIFASPSVEARIKAAREAEDVLRRFHSKGARVVFEAPKPIFRSPTFRCAEKYNLTNPICRDGSEIDRAELERLRKPILDTLQQLAMSVPDVSVWDPLPVLCPSGEHCSAYSNGRPLFFDGDHVSGYGNGLLLPSFRAFISGAPI